MPFLRALVAYWIRARWCCRGGTGRSKKTPFRPREGPQDHRQRRGHQHRAERPAQHDHGGGDLEDVLYLPFSSSRPPMIPVSASPMPPGGEVGLPPRARLAWFRGGGFWRRRLLARRLFAMGLSSVPPGLPAASGASCASAARLAQLRGLAAPARRSGGETRRSARTTSSALSRTRRICPVVSVITVSGVTSMCSIRSLLSTSGTRFSRVSQIIRLPDHYRRDGGKSFHQS